jgi:hypothetical protein
MSQGIVPNFLIVGAGRSGTTSLYTWLNQHPQAYLPARKEPSFFVNGYGVRDWQQYLSLFAPGSGKRAIGEASTLYLCAPESPAWIHRELGTLRIIMILRDPVRRALSLYAWMMMEGYESASSFEAALHAEEHRLANPSFIKNCPQAFWDYYYFTSGLYAEQVRRYLDTFGKSNLRIYLFEEMQRNPAALFADVCRFLEIDPGFVPSLEPTNQSCMPKWNRLQYILRGARWKPGCARIVASAMELNRKLGANAQMRPATERRLRQKYRQNIRGLAELIGKDLSAWLA